VSPEWSPDDSLMEPDDKGRVQGARRVVDALHKHNVRYGNGVITSRDKGVAAAQRELKRTGMPPGVEQWQVPIVFRPDGDVLSFMGRMKPGARVPPHSHSHAVVRVIIGGSLKYGRLTLKVGDWMYVPAGQVYSVTAGPDGCTTTYHHGICRILDLSERAGPVTRSVSRSTPR
jgi:anti-sigma factor ChrR (cupin superfamily)